MAALAPHAAAGCDATLARVIDAVELGAQCSICLEAMTDPHWLSNCRHTFCKACLLKSFAAGSTTCPHCAVSLGPHPANGILFDRTLQALVDKVFTDLEEVDRASEEAFYARLGIKRKPDPDDAPTGHAEAAASSKAKRSRGSIDVEINFKLSPDTSAALPSGLRLTALDKPYQDVRPLENQPVEEVPLEEAPGGTPG